MGYRTLDYVMRRPFGITQQIEVFAKIPVTIQQVELSMKEFDNALSEMIMLAQCSSVPDGTQ